MSHEDIELWVFTKSTKYVIIMLWDKDELKRKCKKNSDDNFVALVWNLYYTIYQLTS